MFAEEKSKELQRPAFIAIGDWASLPALRGEIEVLKELQQQGLKARSSPNHRGPQLEYQHFHLTYEVQLIAPMSLPES